MASPPKGFPRRDHQGPIRPPREHPFDYSTLYHEANQFSYRNSPPAVFTSLQSHQPTMASSPRASLFSKSTSTSIFHDQSAQTSSYNVPPGFRPLQSHQPTMAFPPEPFRFPDHQDPPVSGFMPLPPHQPTMASLPEPFRSPDHQDPLPCGFIPLPPHQPTMASPPEPFRYPDHQDPPVSGFMPPPPHQPTMVFTLKRRRSSDHQDLTRPTSPLSKRQRTQQRTGKRSKRAKFVKLIAGLKSKLKIAAWKVVLLDRKQMYKAAHAQRARALGRNENMSMQQFREIVAEAKREIEERNTYKAMRAWWRKGWRSLGLSDEMEHWRREVAKTGEGRVRQNHASSEKVKAMMRYVERAMSE